MTIKGYSSFPKSPQLEPYHLIQFNVIPKTPLIWEEGLTLLQSQRILSPVDGAIWNMTIHLTLYLNYELISFPRKMTCPEITSWNQSRCSSLPWQDIPLCEDTAWLRRPQKQILVACLPKTGARLTKHICQSPDMKSESTSPSLCQNRQTPQNSRWTAGQTNLFLFQCVG